MRKHSIVSLAIDYQQHVWAINFNGLFLDFSALRKCRLLALHKPFKNLSTVGAYQGLITYSFSRYQNSPGTMFGAINSCTPVRASPCPVNKDHHY